MYTRTFVLFLLFDLYTFIIIFAIMSEKGRDRYLQGRLSCLHEQSALHISDSALFAHYSKDNDKSI